MKKTGIITLALLSGMLTAGTFQFDLSKTGSLGFVGNTAKGEKKGWEKVKVIDVKGKKVQQLAWNVKSSPYMLYHPGKGMTFNKYSSMVCKFKIEVPQGCPITAINLRFLDKHGEVFQFRQLVNLKKGGVFTIEIPLDKKHLHVAWGGKPANKKVDQPIRFHEIAFDYPRNATQEVKITVLSITAETVDSPKTAVARPVYTIGDDTRFFG